MNIEDCKIGTRVVCLSDEANLIPVGALGTVIEDYKTCVYVSWDKKHSFDQYTVGDYSNVTGMYLEEIEKLPKAHVPEKEIAKLTVSVSVEDKEEIAKDILKIVLEDLNVIISDAIVSLSNDKDDELTGFDFSDEKLRQLLDEATKDVMKEIIREQITSLNKQDSTI